MQTTSPRIERFARAFLPCVETASPALALPSFTGSSAAFAVAALALRDMMAASTRGPQNPEPPTTNPEPPTTSHEPRTTNHKPPFVFVVTPGLPEADALADDLRVLEKECPLRVVEFPPALEDDRATTATRAKTAAILAGYAAHPYPLALVAPLPALSGGVPQAARVAAQTTRLAVGGDAANPSFADLQKRLLAAGYERAPEVTAAGQFAVRGGVLDAWPPDAARPVRAEYFGDDLESLRFFDAATQTSVGAATRVELPPVAVEEDGGETLLDVLPPGRVELWLGEAASRRFADFGLRTSDFELQGFAGRSGVPPLQNEDGRQQTEDKGESREKKREAAGRRFPKPRTTNHEPRTTSHLTLCAGDPPPPGMPTATFPTAPLPGFADVHAQDAANDPALIDAVRLHLKRHLAAAARKGALVVEDDELSGGFETDGLVVAAKSDRVLAARRRRSSRGAARANTGERFSESLDLEPGELVVHVDYGIGRYEGTTEIEVGGKRAEVFTVAYADGGKLHVPVAHAHLLSRYVGVKGEHVKLHRLDGRRWKKEKDAAQRAVRDLAASLLETQARRAVVPGFAYDLDVPGRAAFDAAFPYETTRDQQRAIDAVLGDMAAAKPMDRLICGDAGYGKTEVALRAAFIAAMNGKQVAVLAPTTVLAEQHYETFLARFENTPVRVETLSRFVDGDAKRGVCARLLSGAADVVIGTHALLSDKVRFHDLGLIVIDEEQRFGVRHKEHLKQLRATADVLTMSATPIPRTLSLSLTGARDFSPLRTPPRERVAVETKIVHDFDDVVRAALEREFARGGQTYYVYNRVATMGRVETRVRTLLPKARVETAHAQMSAATLAAKMQRFAKGEIDVLVCTTIVESGLDVPRANTIIVDRADRFGLAELYQLRGRVGRSTRQGYAYFLTPSEGLMDAEARERLDALRRYGGLGAGFNVAMRDLEIRGAGNLLGREQSGHVAAVGFQLYCQLLQRTIARFKGEKVRDVVDVSLNLDFLDYSPGRADADETGACLPYDYVEEEAQRMDFHKRLAETATTGDVRKLKGELADRYGRLPKAAERLIKMAELRVLCAQNGIARIDCKNGRAVAYGKGENGVAFVARIDGATADRKLAALEKVVSG